MVSQTRAHGDTLQRVPRSLYFLHLQLCQFPTVSNKPAVRMTTLSEWTSQSLVTVIQKDMFMNGCRESMAMPHVKSCLSCGGVRWWESSL